MQWLDFHICPLIFVRFGFRFVSRSSIKIWNGVGNVVVRFRIIVGVPSQHDRIFTSNVIFLVTFPTIVDWLDVIDVQARRGIHGFDFGGFRWRDWVAGRPFSPWWASWCESVWDRLFDHVFLVVPSQKFLDLSHRSVFNWRVNSMIYAFYATFAILVFISRQFCWLLVI